MAKSVEEILTSKDGEAAFLLLNKPRDNEPNSPEVEQVLKHLDALQDLASPWYTAAFEGGILGVFGKITTDDGRHSLMEATRAESGLQPLITLFADERYAAHRPLILDFFIEYADDPGYFDELLEDQADKLTDDQKLKLLDAKRKLG